jgi:hypothetical protein
MSRWLRINEDCIDHPKLLKLPEALRWQWLALLCVASKNDGVLPAIEDVALCLRVTEVKAAEYITKLVKANLIDRVGENFVPHNWTKRQFKSDSSTDRVKRHRDKQRNVPCNVSGNVSSSVSETVTETAPQQSRAETDSEQNTTDCRALDEIGLKNEKALCAMFTALCLNLNRSPPDLRPITGWLLDGVAMGTINTIVTPILKRKADMASLSYCDAAVREAHSKLVQVKLQIVPPGEFIVEGTLEWNCWERHLRETTGRGSPVTDSKDANDRFRRGWWRPTKVPPGYDEATGEKLPPASEEDAA